MNLFLGTGLELTEDPCKACIFAYYTCSWFAQDLLTVSEFYQGHTGSYFPDQTQTHWGQLLSHTPEVEQREPEDDNASSRFHVSLKRWVYVYLDNRLYLYLNIYIYRCIHVRNIYIYTYSVCIYIYTFFSYCRTPPIDNYKGGFLLLSVGSWNNKSFGCKSPWIHPSWWTWWVGASWANKNWTSGMGENNVKIAPPILVVNLLNLKM